METKKTLWKVLIICLISGIIAHFSMVRLLICFAITTLPDGTTTVDSTRELILFGIMYIAVLLIGGFIFLRKLTRREIFRSASIVVIYGSVLLFIQWIFKINTGVGALIFYYLNIPLEWCSFISVVAIKILGAGKATIWIGPTVQLFGPYLFVLFGRRKLYSEIEQEANR